MRKFLAILAIIGQSYMAMAVVGGIQIGFGRYDSFWLSLALLIGALFDLSYVNYRIWKSVTNKKSV